jgi:hypothetical protein
MKLYEGLTNVRLLPGAIVCARLDGRNFHSFTKHAKRPFSETFHRMMVNVTEHLVVESCATVGYTQSDEISLAWLDHPFFDGNAQKMCSTLAAMASVRLNALAWHYDDGKASRDVKAGLKWSQDPTFDCRVWVVPSIVEAATTVTDWNREKETYNTKPSPEQDVFLTPRYALQQLGTEWGRSCYPNIWVDYALRTAKKLLEEDRREPNMVNYYSAKSGLMFVGGLEKPVGVAISDVRFKNEIDAIHEAGGIIIRMSRGTGLSGVAGEHRSETEQQGLDDELFDITIDNREWSLEQLESYIDQIAWAHVGTHKEKTT